MRPAHVFQWLKIAIENNYPTLLKSAPGCAKTSLVEQACEESGVKLIISHPVVNESVDYRGMPWIFNNPETNRPMALFVPFNQLEALVSAKEKTVFFFDDLGQAVSSVQAACMQLILARSLNEHKISDHVTFFAATNRKQDKAGVSGILEPVKSRFHTIIEVEVHTDDWIEWAYKNGIPSGLVQYIRWRKGKALMDFQPTLDISNSPCPRTVSKVGEMLRNGVPEALRMDVFTGACGEAWAREFTSFLRIMENLPDIEDILKRPDKAPVPAKDKADVTYAICGALIERATKDNFKNIITYAQRLPVEYALVIVRDCVLRDKKLHSTPAFQAWIRENREVFV